MSDNAVSVRNKMDVPWYKEGRERPLLFSSADMNVHVAILRALVNPEVRWGDGDKAELSDANFVIQLDEAKAGGAGASQFMLINHSAPDYFVCRRFDATDPEDPEDPPDFTDVIVAKPHAIRQSTHAGKTVSIVVETFNGTTFASSVRRIFYNYLSATFRTATDVDDESIHENQTIIPRFVPAVADGTVAPTIIMAAKATGLGVLGPGGVPVEWLAQNDGWAWAKTT